VDAVWVVVTNVLHEAHNRFDRDLPHVDTFDVKDKMELLDALLWVQSMQHDMA